jgi:hypothetical protein
MSDFADLAGLQLDDSHRNSYRNISHFEALPAELRHEILRYVLHTMQARLSNPHRVTFPGVDKIRKSRSFDWHVPVLQVCRTLYNDGKSILYRENQVSLSVCLVDTRSTSCSRWGCSCRTLELLDESAERRLCTEVFFRQVKLG